jgi:adenosylcobinamide amidohydrolase
MAPSRSRFAIDHTPDHVHVAFPEPRPVLSSAVLNGGLLDAMHILNLRVEKNVDGGRQDFDPSHLTLQKYCRKMRWTGPAVGMMTAAKMSSFRKAHWEERHTATTILATAGISNAGRAGDPADFQEPLAGEGAPGTINIIVLTDAVLTPAAMIEAVQMVTEAKAAALQNLGVRSVKSGRPATGTGTDAVAIAGGAGPATVSFCGKHTLYGEKLAAAVISALTSSLGG